MPVIRNRLANRRQISTVSLMWPPNSGERYHVTVGEYENGAPGGVWVHGAKVGNEFDALLSDARYTDHRLSRLQLYRRWCEARFSDALRRV